MKLLLTLLLFSSILWAQSSSFKSVGKDVEAGVEIEITDKELRYILSDLDLEYFQEQVSHRLHTYEWENLFKDYLKNTEAFDTLPLEIQTKLTQGLEEVHPRVVIQPANMEEMKRLGLISSQVATGFSDNSSSGGILLPDNKEKAKPVEVKKPNRSEFITETLEQQQFLRQAKQAKELALEKKNWKIINERWNALDLPTKIRNGKFKYVNKKVMAAFVIEVLEKKDSEQNILRLRSDLPPLRQKVFSNYKFFRDGDTLEFNHIKIYDDMERFYSSIQKLLSAVNSSNYLFEPLSAISDAGIHLHLNRKDRSHISVQFAHALNYLLLLELINNGADKRILERHQQVAYKENPHRKGLLSLPLYDRSQIEIRVQTKDVKTFLLEVVDLLNMPEEEAIVAMYKRVQANINQNSINFFKENQRLGLLDSMLMQVSEKLNASDITLREDLRNRARTLINIKKALNSSSLENFMVFKESIAQENLSLKNLLTRIVNRPDGAIAMAIFNAFTLIDPHSSNITYGEVMEAIKNRPIMELKLINDVTKLSTEELESTIKAIFYLSSRSRSIHKKFIKVALNSPDPRVWKITQQLYLDQPRILRDAMHLIDAHEFNKKFVFFLFDNVKSLSVFASGFLRYVEIYKENPVFFQLKQDYESIFPNFLAPLQEPDITNTCKKDIEFLL